MFIIGAYGRVDIVCGSGKVVLLLLKENETLSAQNNDSRKLVWKISKETPATELSVFTETEFTEVLEQLIL